MTDRYTWPVPSPGDATPDPGQPIPFTLAPKAHALLREIPDGQWACEQCGAAFFGTPPGHGLCPDCRGGDGR